MRGTGEEDLQWLVQEVEKTEQQIRGINQQLLPYEKLSELPSAVLAVTELWGNIATALRDIGLDDVVIQTFDQGMEDFQKGSHWAMQAIENSDPYRPLAIWSLDRLCRARRRITEVSTSVMNRLQLIQSAAKCRDACPYFPAAGHKARPLRVVWSKTASRGIGHPRNNS
jgi:hypothetical protein